MTETQSCSETFQTNKSFRHLNALTIYQHSTAYADAVLCYCRWHTMHNFSIYECACLKSILLNPWLRHVPSGTFHGSVFTPAGLIICVIKYAA